MPVPRVTQQVSQLYQGRLTWAGGSRASYQCFKVTAPQTRPWFIFKDLKPRVLSKETERAALTWKGCSLLSWGRCCVVQTGTCAPGYAAVVFSFRRLSRP